jgi:hypothetical protein
MRLAIMQPYFLPYIGYWQLMAAVDTFVVYDQIKYTKKGWINRNRMLLNGDAAMFSLPLAKASDELDVVQRELADSFDRRKLLAQLVGAYRKAPEFEAVLPLLERVVLHSTQNLFDYLWHSIREVAAHLGLETRLVRSSSLDVDSALKAQDKVLALCAAAGAQHYVNAIGGFELYQREAFGAQGLELQFLRSNWPVYAQFGSFEHVPWLSIVDVLMFNPLPQVQAQLRTEFELL